MNLETILQTFGFPALVLMMLALALYRSLNYLGSRLFDREAGFVTLLATRHIEFLDNLERSNNAMLTAQQEHSLEMQEQTRVLRTLMENTTILAREIPSG